MAKRPFTHKQLKNMLAIYEDLAPETKAVVADHVQTCARCRQILQQHQTVDAVLQALEAPVNPSRLRQGFHEGLRLRRQTRRGLWGRLSQVSLAAPTAVLLLGLVVAGFWLIMRTTALNPAASLATSVPAVTATSTPEPTATSHPTATATIAPASLQKIAELFQYETAVSATALSPDGQWLAAGNAQGVITVWKTADGSRTYNSVVADSAIVALAVDGEQLAFVSETGLLQVYDLRADTILWEVALTNSEQVQLALAEGGLVAVAQHGADVVLRDANTERHLPYTRQVGALVFGENGRFLYTGLPTGEVQQWDVASAYREQVWQVQDGPIVALSLAENENQLAYVAASGKVAIWSVVDQEIVSEWYAESVNEQEFTLEAAAENKKPLSIVLSGSRLQFAMGTRRGAIELWSNRTMK